MTIYIALISVLTITVLVFLINKAKMVRPICPVCAGVSLTWLWLLVANVLGQNFDWLVLGILMGGSVVGISYAKEIKNAGLTYKTVFVTAGFFAVYELLNGRLEMFAAGALLSGAIFLFTAFSSVKQARADKVDEIKDSLKDCCG